MPLPKKVAPAAPVAPPPVAKVKKAAPPRRASGAQTRAAQMPPLDPTGTSDLAIAMRELMVGGPTRLDVTHRVAALLADRSTRGGKPKPTSTIINHVINRALAHGYRIVSSWKLERDPDYVPPEDEIDVKVTETARGIQVEVTTPPPAGAPEPAKVSRIRLPKKPPAATT